MGNQRRLAGLTDFGNGGYGGRERVSIAKTRVRPRVWWLDSRTILIVAS